MERGPVENPLSPSWHLQFAEEKADDWNHKEIDCRNRFHMIANEGFPGLQWPIWTVSREGARDQAGAALASRRTTPDGLPHSSDSKGTHRE
jgi:hypothetical protein